MVLCTGSIIVRMDSMLAIIGGNSANHLRHQRIKLIEVFGQDLELIVDLVDTINGLEYGSQ
jgi:hypothetical protein